MVRTKIPKPIGHKNISKIIKETISFNKALFEKYAPLIDNFLKNSDENNGFKVLIINKFFQKINKLLLEEQLTKQGVKDAEIKLKELNNFINQKTFTIVGICKEIKPDAELAPPSDARNKYVGHISELSPELICILLLI